MKVTLSLQTTQNAVVFDEKRASIQARTDGLNEEYLGLVEPCELPIDIVNLLLELLNFIHVFLFSKINNFGL